MPFTTVHLEIFHCTYHPVIPESDLYFTFCSTLKNIKITANGYLIIALGNGINSNTPLSSCGISVVLYLIVLSNYTIVVMFFEVGLGGILHRNFQENDAQLKP